MAVKKSFSTLRASGNKVISAVGYTAASIELGARALVIASAQLNDYLSKDMSAEAKKLVIKIDNQLQGKE